MRQSLARRPFDYSQVSRRNDTWVDHVARTNVTASLIAWLKPKSVMDPACGDGSIVLLADRIYNTERILFADVSVPNCVYLANYGLSHVEARCQDIMTSVNTDERFDVVVLTEILEHIPDPDEVLRRASGISEYLIASSPEMRPGQVDTNEEHVWMFDGDGYYQMLAASGWTPFQKTHMAFPTSMYDFQIWVCKART